MLSDLEKKNCWTLAQRAGHGHPGRLQRLLDTARWDADVLRVGGVVGRRLAANPRVGVELRHKINVDRLMWGSDFPHQESDWPESLKIIDKNFSGSVIRCCTTMFMARTSLGGLFRLYACCVSGCKPVRSAATEIANTTVLVVPHLRQRVQRGHDCPARQHDDRADAPRPGARRRRCDAASSLSAVTRLT
mgnify:CR=1 FL=1